MCRCYVYTQKSNIGFTNLRWKRSKPPASGDHRLWQTWKRYDAGNKSPYMVIIFQDLVSMYKYQSVIQTEYTGLTASAISMYQRSRVHFFWLMYTQ